jgi:peptidoglycan hydrolase-like protein with peptidoglycan-binding domain
MFTLRTGSLAVSGIAIAAAGVLSLSTTAASAATTTASAPSQATASQAVAAAPSGCVTEQFSIADESTYYACVADEQILLNDLWYYQEQHPNHEVPTYLGVNQLLTVDGSYGPDTTSDVRYFQTSWNLHIDGTTGKQTWGELCYQDWLHGYTGTYWHDAGCATESL